MIRRAQAKDIDEILIIEKQSFPVAWEYTEFLNICLLRGKTASKSIGIVYMDVLEQGGRIVGYVVWEIDTKKDMGHILNIAVQQNERRKGNGKMLLLHVVQHLKSHNVSSCRLEVRESNLPARTLYEANGFIATSKIYGYYFDEDAIVYTLSIQS
ncbi:MAG: GNAT family N-acetyltransferase [Candidatus Thorarchaeota archaeon]